jgi:hypothetical protein
MRALRVARSLHNSRSARRSALNPLALQDLMSRCSHCGKILPDDWIIREGASLMGRRGDKVRTPEKARKAAKARWAQEGAKEKKKKRRRKKK